MESESFGLDGAYCRNEKKYGSEVHLNVYDMIWVNDYITQFGIGAYHTGVVVHGEEHAYGGHPYSYTGVYELEPMSAPEVIAPSLKFRESIPLGYTPLSKRETEEMIRSVGREFIGKEYHIFKKNCNHFSDELSVRLTGSHIPCWVNRLAYISSWMPFILNCLPPSWVTPGDPEVNNQTSPVQLFSSYLKSPMSTTSEQLPETRS